MIVGLGKAWFPAWKKYRQEFKKRGIEVRTLDFFTPGWGSRLSKINSKIDFYFWHSDTWEEDYRQIHDRVYFIENIAKKPIFPDMNQYFSYNDKIKQKEMFDFLKVPQLNTVVCRDQKSAIAAVKKFKYPAVIKDAYSACGEGIFKINSKPEALSAVKKIFNRGYRGIKGYLYLQEFVPGLEGDIRIITIGNKIAAAYWRRSKTDWRHNITMGAAAEFAGIPDKAKRLCLDISKKMKFHWMSYDIIIKKGRPIILEWSCNFGVKAPSAHGCNIRGLQAEYAINLMNKKK